VQDAKQATPQEGGQGAAGTGAPRRRDQPLLWHLGVVLAAALLPMIALEAFLLLQLAAAERARHEMEARDAAGRISAAVERELASLESVLKVLASSDLLAAGDIAAFHRRSRAVPRPPGAEIALRTISGRLLASSGEAWGGAAAAREDRRDAETDRAAATTLRTQFSDLVPAGAEARFSVVAPVLVEGRAAFLLSLDVPAIAMQAVLAGAGVPARMVGSLLDRRGTIITRSQEPERFVARRLPLDAAPLSAPGRQGWLRTTDLEGRRVALAYSRSDITGWTSIVFLPAADFEAPLRRSLWTAALLGAALALLAAALASLAARRIAHALGALAGIAEAKGQEQAPPLATPVREVNRVGDALARARAEAAQRAGEREELLRMFDQAQVMVRDPSGRASLWTSGKERLLGWTPAEVLGRDCHVLLRTEFPRPRAEIEAEFLRRGEWQGELRLHHRDGRALTVASRWSLRRDAGGAPLAVVESCNDITALREAEDALRGSRDLLASILAGSADPILATDGAGRLVVMNEPAARAFGVPLATAPGRRLGEIASAEAGAVEETAREVLASGEPRAVEFELAGAEGGARSFMATLAPWRHDRGDVTGVVCVAREVTHRRRAEARMREMQGELLHVSRLSAMGAIASAMAHELNQPLTACANFANAARRMLAAGVPQRQDDLADALAALEEASEQAVLAGQIVRRMRSFVTRDDGDKRPTALNAVIRDAAALALLDAREMGVSARLDLDPADPVALCDRVQVQQVVVNLVRNAVEAMREVPRRELVLASRVSGEELVEVSVADTGPGLRPAVAERLFEPFVSTKPGGMGVGLWICRSIVEEHGGTLLVAANPGGGSVFRFTLPAMRNEERTPDAE
jgi:two-component system sensor kinase FixL